MWEVRVARSGDGQQAARVPAGSDVFVAGHVFGQICKDLRSMSEDEFLERYGKGGGDTGGMREPRLPGPPAPTRSAEAKIDR